MTTTNLSGFRGEATINPGFFDLYLCDDTFQVNTKKTETTTQSGRIFITSAPRNARWFKGYIHGLMTIETEYSMYTITGNGGAPFHMENCTGFTVERLKIDGHCWDPIRAGPGCINPNIIDCWIQWNVDDAIEADAAPSEGSTITVRRTFFDRIHTLISGKRGGSGAPEVPFGFVFIDCVIQFGDRRDSRANRMYPWNNTNYGHGQYIKVALDGQLLTVKLLNNIIRADSLPKQAASNHIIIPPEAVIDPTSGGNIYVWRGGTPAGVSMVSVPKIGGGTVSVPTTLGLHTARISAIFTVTDDLAVWNNAVDNWMANVWGGAAAAGPDAVDDTGYDVVVGGNQITIPVLDNDTRVSADLHPVVTLSGSPATPTGPVTTSIVSNQLRVTSHATNTGAWSQVYQVVTDDGGDTAVASGTVLAAPPPDPTVSPGSAMVWIKPATVHDGWPISIDGPAGFGFRTFADGSVGVYFEGPGSPSTVTSMRTAAGYYTANQVVMLATTWGPNGANFWVDGDFVATTTAHTTGLAGNTNPWRIGKGPGSSPIFNGVIDDFATWAGRLTAEEIEDLAAFLP
jgi:hypothetical protein